MVPNEPSTTSSYAANRGAASEDFEPAESFCDQTLSETKQPGTEDRGRLITASAVDGVVVVAYDKEKEDRTAARQRIRVILER